MDANSALFTLSAIVQSLAAVVAIVGTFITFGVLFLGIITILYNNLIEKSE